MTSRHFEVCRPRDLKASTSQPGFVKLLQPKVCAMKENVFEMQTIIIERNEPLAKTEQAMNLNKRSDSMMLKRLLYFITSVAVLSLVIASTALVLVLSQSPPTTLTDPTTEHGKISMEFCVFNIKGQSSAFVYFLVSLFYYLAKGNNVSSKVTLG